MISAPWPRAPATTPPAWVRGGSPTATLAISVAVSIANQRPLFIPAPLQPECGVWNAECGMDRARFQTRGTHPGSNPALQFRTPHSTFHTHAPTARPSPQLLQQAHVWRVAVAEVEVPIQRRRPQARPLGPFDQHDGTLPRHVVESEVAGFVRRLEAIAVDVVDGRGAGLVVMHQRVGGARRQRPGA